MEDKKVNVKNNKKIILIIIGLIICIAIILTIKYFSNPVMKFKQNLDNLDVSKLQEIYSSTQSYDEKKKIEKIFKDKLESIVEEFVNGTKSYENAIEEIDKYKNIKGFENTIKLSKEDIEKIKVSKDDFGEGQNNANSGKVLEAIKSYSKVIELDKNNYKIAQDYIKDNQEE